MLTNRPGLTKNDQPVEQLERDIRTTNKSMDAIPAAWLRRNVFQPGRTSPAAWSCTVPRLIGRPRSRASAVRRITAALPQGILLAHSSDEVAALAVDLEGGHHVGTISSANRPESPADATVSGLTTVIAFRISGKIGTARRRSTDRSSAVATATGTYGSKRSPADAEPGCSASRLARDFSLDPATSSSLTRNANIAPSTSTAIALRHPDEVFGSDR